jgi:phage gpG-like protein
MHFNLFGGDATKSPFRFHKIHLPKREFLGFSEKDKTNLANIASSTLKNHIEGDK